MLSLIPNALSLSRIPLAAMLVVFYDRSSAPYFWIGVGIVSAALVTDFLDGYIARRNHGESVAGYFLDGLGDKVFYAAILIIIAREEPAQTVVAWMLIARELIWYGLRAIDPLREQNRLFLRSYSLIYALAIRIYFAGFILSS